MSAIVINDHVEIHPSLAGVDLLYVMIDMGDGPVAALLSFKDAEVLISALGNTMEETRRRRVS